MADPAAEVRAVLKAINDAWTGGRPDDLAPLLHPAVVMVHPGFSGRSEGRDACIDSYREFVRRAHIHEFRAGDARVDVWGDTAVATYDFAIAYHLDGEDLAEAGHDVFVLARIDGGWLALWRTVLAGPGV